MLMIEVQPQSGNIYDRLSLSEEYFAEETEKKGRGKRRRRYERERRDFIQNFHGSSPYNCQLIKQ